MENVPGFYSTQTGRCERDMDKLVDYGPTGLSKKVSARLREAPDWALQAGP